MAEAYLGEIRMMGFSFNPIKWAKCDGQILPITENPALYSLLGTQFGGDGRTTFALPDLRGRVPLHPGDDKMGSLYKQGYYGGTEEVTLNSNELPKHTHSFNVGVDTGLDNKADPNGSLLTTNNSASDGLLYGDSENLIGLNQEVISSSGAGKAHNNIQPMQVINFCIALEGLYPSQN